MIEVINKVLKSGEDYLIIFLVALIFIVLLVKIISWLIIGISFLWKKIYEYVIKKPYEYVIEKMNLFFKCNIKKEMSISEILKELSKREQKSIRIAKYIKQLSNKDSTEVLNSLKNKQLVELFPIRANIEEYFNSNKGVDKDILKYTGFLITFVVGIVSSAFSGVYSGIVANIFSDATLNTKKNYNLASDFEKDIVNDISKIRDVITLDEVVTPMIFMGIIIFTVIVVLTIVSNINMKFNNNYIVLLNVVDYAIEFRKEKEKMESKEPEVTESIKITEDKFKKEIKEIVKKLGGNTLCAGDTTKLISENFDKITYESVQEAVLNCHLSELYNIKANLKNAINAGKFSDSTEIQIFVTLIAIFIALKSNVVVAIFLSVLSLSIFGRYIYLRFREVYNVKLILILEIVENKIEFKKINKESSKN